MPFTVAPASGANSYVGITDADEYFEFRLYSESWFSADEGKKQAALVMATKTIDCLVDWYGTATDPEQKLCFPRTGIVDRNGREIQADEIPDCIKWATCEQALDFLMWDSTRKPAEVQKGILSASVAGMSVTYDKNYMPEHLCDMAYQLLAASGLGDVAANGNGLHNVRLVR